MKTSFWQRGVLSLVWPLPALLVWGGAWLLFVGGQRWLPWWAAAGLAVVFSVGASLWGSTWWRRGWIAAGFPLSFAVLVAGSLPGWGWLLLLGGLLLVYPLNAWRDAPIFPTPAGALQGLAAQLALPPMDEDERTALLATAVAAIDGTGMIGLAPEAWNRLRRQVVLAA